MNHLEPQDDFKQCDVVQRSLELEIEEYIAEQHAMGITDVHVDCCLVTDEEMRKYDPTNPDYLPMPQKVKDSVAVCHTTRHPERALEGLGYGFTLDRWEPADSTDPPGLTWYKLTGQICDNRPFISVKQWKDGDEDGGTHAEVVTGYHFDPNEMDDPNAMKMVDLESTGMNGFHSIPFKHYQGKPGDYVHVRDYYDIFRIGR